MTLQDTFEYENGFSPFQLVGTFVVPLTHTNTHISSGSILQSFHLLRSIFNSDTFHFLFGACLCYFFWRRSFKYWITGGEGGGRWKAISVSSPSSSSSAHNKLPMSKIVTFIMCIVL